MTKLTNFVTVFKLTAPAGGLSAGNIIENAEKLAEDKRLSFKVGDKEAIVNIHVDTEEETFSRFLHQTIEYNLPLFTTLSAVDHDAIIRNAIIAATGKDPLDEDEDFTIDVASTYTSIEVDFQFWHFQTTFVEVEVENEDPVLLAIMVYDGDTVSQLTYDTTANVALMIDGELTSEQEILRDTFMLMLSLTGLNAPTQNPPLTKLIEATSFATFGYSTWNLETDEYPKEFDYINVYDMIKNHAQADSLIYREVVKRYPEITIADVTKDMDEDRLLFPIIDVWSTDEEDVEEFDEDLNPRIILLDDAELEEVSENDFIEKTFGFLIAETTEINDEDTFIPEAFQTMYGVSMGTLDLPADRFSEWKYKLLIPFVKEVALENDSTLYMETEEDMITKFLRQLA